MKTAQMAQATSSYVERANTWVHLWVLLRSASIAIYEDGCLGISKGAAYSGLLAFFPVLTTIAALLVEFRARDVSRTIAAFLYEVVPPGTEDVVRRLFVVQGQRPKTLLVVAVVLAAWAASGAVMSIMEGFRAIYHIPSGRSFVQERLVAVLMVFVLAGPVLGASALIVLGRRSEQTIVYWTGLLPVGTELSGWVSVFGQISRFGLAFGSFVLATALMYYFGPNRRQAFWRVFPGALLATFLWMLATIAFAWWVRHVSNYNVLYGSVGAGLALLVWMYVLAVITLFGCEFNAVQERLEGAERAVVHA
jgi:membrane protein